VRRVDYAHTFGLIHRDIKPANLMLNVHGQAILMDFGIAKIIGGLYHTATGATIGTALYMSPEQVRASPSTTAAILLDRRYLVEMVSGHLPFEADTAMSVMMMHVNDPVPDLRQIQPGTRLSCRHHRKALARTATSVTTGSYDVDRPAKNPGRLHRDADAATLAAEPSRPDTTSLAEAALAAELTLKAAAPEKAEPPPTVTPTAESPPDTQAATRPTHQPVDAGSTVSPQPAPLTESSFPEPATPILAKPAPEGFTVTQPGQPPPRWLSSGCSSSGFSRKLGSDTTRTARRIAALHHSDHCRDCSDLIAHCRA
jgi:serine/threonine protein kinase